jgi:hypothetical protein
MSDAPANGQRPIHRQGDLDSQLQQPPWAAVDPEAMIQQLSGQLNACHLEMAAMRAYIGQLHQALAQAVPAEEPQSAGRHA